ncbi:MAG: SGNH/GDSL hydrolase family protein [Methanosarcinales archaeon]
MDYTDAEFIQVNNNDRIRQNGDISKIKFAVADASKLIEFYFTVWRKSGSGGYDRIGITDNLRGDISDGINEIKLNEPISGVQEGDYYGYRIKTSGPALYIDIHETRLTYYVNNTASSIENYNWEGKNWKPYIFVIEPYMDNLYMVFIGDSIIVGYPQHSSFLHDYECTNIPSTIEYQWSNKVNDIIYQNMGYGGHGTPELQNRFNEDVIQLNPEFALIEGGIIDIRRKNPVVSNEVILNNWRTMIEEAYNNDITPVIMLILPCTDIVNSDSERVDLINEQLITMAAEYSPSIVVDARSYVGIDRSGGGDGNLWDIIPSYTDDDLHFNSDGNERIAQAVKDSFKYIYGKPGLYNLIQSDGTIIYSEGLSNAINTSWRMASTSGTANVIYNEPSYEIADFTINSGIVDWFSICDLSSGQVYYLRNSDGTLIESSTAINEMVIFTTNIFPGTYYVNCIIPDTTDPIILTAAAEPDEIEADGIDNTLLNVNAIDIDSGIASVAINLLALNGPLVQQMSNNSGVWQLTINTTIIGEFSLPVNVTDNAGNSNTSVNILLNTRDTISPVISCPDDMLVEQNVSENIIWIITEIHPDKYWIMRNSTLVEPPADYQSGEPISISINTSTLGIWNYTIIANDTSGYMTIDQVNVSIVSNWRDEWMGENSIGGTVVTTSELQNAIHHWLENIPVGDYTLSTPDLQEIIAVWLLE